MIQLIKMILPFLILLTILLENARPAPEFAGGGAAIPGIVQVERSTGGTP